MNQPERRALSVVVEELEAIAERLGYDDAKDVKTLAFTLDCMTHHPSSVHVQLDEAGLPAGVTIDLPQKRRQA